MAKEEAPKKTRRPTAQKRHIRNQKQRLVNKMFKTRVRSAIRNFQTALPSGDEAAIKSNLSAVYSLMDKGVKRGIYKLNKARRVKARLALRTQKTA